MRRQPNRAHLLLAVLMLPGCMHWKTHPISPDQVVNQKPKEVRIQRRDSTLLQLRQPRVSGDSIVGTPRQSTDAGVSLYDIVRIQTREVDGVATGIGIALGVALIVGIKVFTYDP